MKSVKNRQLTRLAILSLSIFCMVLFTHQVFAAKYNWKFISGIPGSMENKYAENFVALMSKKTNGNVNISLYLEGELGTGKQVAELLQMGAVQFSQIDPGHYSTTIKELEIFNLFFLFPGDKGKMKKVMLNREAKWFQILEDSFNKQGLKIMNLLPLGWNVWTSKRPLRSIEDFKGFKMRVMPSPLLVKTYEMLGASPAALPFGEVYSALQLNVVEGQDNPLFIADIIKFYEVQDYITFPYHLNGIMGVAMNQAWFSTLPDNMQNMIIEVEKECYNQLFIDKINEEDNAKARILKAKPSMNFVKLTAKEIEPIKNAVLPARDIFVKMAGKSGKEMLASLIEEVEKVN
jgi:C4-dicarboxylate-binding protein DctP